MPIRDWKCEKCGFILEDVYFHKESEVELPEKCSKCNKQVTWKRLSSLVGLVKVKDGTPRFHPGK